jgi:hypothetical protein
MERESSFQSYLNGGLETFGIDADLDERAVMIGVWSLYEPGMELLRDADIDGIEPEAHADLSKPPER